MTSVPPHEDENQSSKKLVFDKCIIYTNNPEAAEYLYKEIFEEEEYPLNIKKEDPFFIDCGSNIGCSTLYFKNKFPQARVLSFEPDPKTFQLLEKNVRANNLSRVELVNAALAGQNGKLKFYGQLFGSKTDSLGNSALQAWGHKTYSDVIEVDAVQLSSYINENVDFLKIDVEGSEQVLLEDLQKNDKLKFINQLSMEVHETRDIYEVNNLKSILEILKNNNFDFEVIERDPHSMLPPELEKWAQENQPKIYVVHAKRIS